MGSLTTDGGLEVAATEDPTSGYADVASLEELILGEDMVSPITPATKSASTPTKRMNNKNTSPVENE